MNLYMFKIENDGYLIVNYGATKESEVFSSTKKLSESTMFNKEMMKKMKDVIKSYNKHLYISNEHQFIKVVGIEKYELNKVSNEELI